MSSSKLFVDSGLDVPRLPDHAISPYYAVGVLLLPAIYIAYYRYFHPLSKYPGPFLASFSNLWKAYHLFKLRMPEDLRQLHELYGDVVRVGPNDLSFSSAKAVAPIYKAGRDLPKTGFYDGFTTFNPNLFGSRDEKIHAIRRRQVSYSFSFQSICKMESYIDKHLRLFRVNLDHHADAGDIFDMKELVSFYVLDVLGELAFSRSFDAQIGKDPEKLPPINDHIYLACLMGMMPEMLPILRAVAAWTPLPWFQSLFRARGQLRDLTAACVDERLSQNLEHRTDLLGSLITAVDPETGAKLTPLDIKTEAFAMVVAGSHTTSGTLTLLFSHLLQNSGVLGKVVAEIDAELSDPTEDVVSVKGLEAKLPYTMACVHENFRINPVFSMPLPRQVTSREGHVIDGQNIPAGTAVFALNHVVHHNPSVWGDDHDVYNPSRFLGPKAEYHKRNLTPFGIGHRMCIGKNMAMTNLLKVLVTVLRHYDLEMEDSEKKITTLSVGISEKEGPLLCRVRRRHSLAK